MKADYKYSASFIEKVKRLYPNSTEMHRQAEQNGYFLGRYLDDSSSSSISIQEVLNARSLQELQDKAKAQLEKVNLYKEWSKEVGNQEW